MIALNCYTRQQIYSSTGEKVDSEIVVVGNAIERHNLEQYILKRQNVAVIGPPMSGKLCAVAQICEKHNIGIDMHYGELGEYDEDNIHIIRYPKIRPNERGTGIVALCKSSDEIPTGFKSVILNPPTPELIAAYELAKLRPMANFGGNRIQHKWTELSYVTKHLSGKSTPENIPEYTHRWIARNFYDHPNALKICLLAMNIKDRLIYWGLLRLIKATHVNLKYPVWVKRNVTTNG